MKKFIFGMVLAFAISAFGWGEDMHMKNVSTNQPAADAQLTHQKDDNGNVKIKVHFYHLAKPDSLTPAKDAYVVWIEPNGQPHAYPVMRHRWSTTHRPAGFEVLGGDQVARIGE